MPVAEHTSSHEYTAAASAGRWSSRATSESPSVPGRIRPGGRRERVVELPSGARHVKEPSFLDHATTHPQRKRPSIDRSTAPVVQILELALKVFCTASARA